jgi:predicted dehydrogenase
MAVKVLQVGLGSMGKRRIRNYQALGVQDILGYDLRDDRRDEATDLYGVPTVQDLNEAPWGEITHVSISTPPHHHNPYAMMGLQKDKHVFIEASVIAEGLSDLLSLSKNRKSVLAPSCTMRFDSIVKKAHSLITEGAIGSLLYGNHYFGQYLPDWHPYESIQDFYVSNPLTGAAREIVPFDLVYLTQLLGAPRKGVAMIQKTGVLDAPIDDIYSLLYSTEQCQQVHVTIDVVSRASYRQTKIVGSAGNIEIDNVAGTVRVFRAHDKSWEEFTREQLCGSDSGETMYVDEIRAFLAACRGETAFPYSLEEDIQILSYLKTFEESEREGSIKAFE